jgi:hypothetical protein
MLEFLSFAFMDAWHFLGCLLFLIIVTKWRLITININSGTKLQDVLEQIKKESGQ